MGLQVQHIKIPVAKIPSIPTPALISYEDSFAVIYDTSVKEVVLDDPARGIKCLRLKTFADLWGQSGEGLLLQPKADTPKQKFGLSWFFPAIIRYRKVLLEVLVASFFVQLFGLVNPLMTQTIIDQVIGGISLDTLHVFGALMVILAVFEAVLGALRTYLFSDTTNRIDMGLASQVIDRLVRLPMSYFGTRTTMARETQQAEVTSKLGEIESLQQEQGRLKSAITQTQANRTNTLATFYSDLQHKITANQQRIAEIDSQLGKQIMANDKQIAELDSQIASHQQNLKYHQLKAPASGTIFELKAHDGFVAQPSKPLLEIVPEDSLIAQVYIPSKNRGFVKSGMDVDVLVDSFDFSEFGDIPGKLIWVGADALEPDEQHPYPRYPAKIELENQTIMANGESMSLQSGMAISVNIKKRKRRVISVFSGFLATKLNSLKEAK